MDQLFYDHNLDTLLDITSLLEVSRNNTLQSSDISFLENRFNKIRYYENGFPAIIDSRGVFIIHPRTKGSSVNKICLLKSAEQKMEAFHIRPTTEIR
jgi:hypothetical protein